MRYLITYCGLQKRIMIDLKTYINNFINTTRFSEKANTDTIITFFEDNEWFHITPIIKDEQFFLTDEQVNLITPKLELFLSCEGTTEEILQMLTEAFPHTAQKLIDFFTEEKTDKEFQFYIADFLLYRLSKDVSLYNDDEIKELLVLATFEMIKTHGDYFTFFLAWLRVNTKTNYYHDYIMDKRYTMDIQNEAYSFDEYLQLVYYLLNEEYVEENDMFTKAAESKNFTDTWLYLSMHFISSLRRTDLIRIYHPDLPYPAQEVIERIKDGTFTDNDARMVLLSVTTRMCVLPFIPSKESDKQGIADVKFHIPTSCEVLFGKLFALAEAHKQLAGCPDEPIIRKISTYEEINRYMGEEIGALFLESDFRSRSATKSYLQAVYMLADDILLDEQNGPRVKGYILAALARSHKGSYGEFAATTFEYLKDAKFSGLTPEFIAFELFERGVLSFIPSTLLKMITDGEYEKLSVHNQTQLIKALNLSPHEIESVVSVVGKGRKQAEIIAQEIINSHVDVMTALHRIGSGQAFSKEPECLCLLSAIEKLCPYAQRRQCVGCKYEISTKSTLYLLISEYNRMKLLYQNATSELEKNKYKQLILNVIVPKMDEMLSCMKETYGEEIFKQYEELIKENT